MNAGRCPPSGGAGRARAAAGRAVGPPGRALTMSVLVGVGDVVDGALAQEAHGAPHATGRPHHVILDAGTPRDEQRPSTGAIVVCAVRPADKVSGELTRASCDP